MTGRDHYADIYSSQLDAEAKWLAFGAVHKADSIELLMAGKERSSTVLELGAGTGAVIAELQRRAFADKYVAVEYAPHASAHMRKHLRGVEVRELDIVKDPISERVNVVVISHVLEHLEEPELMLSNVAKIDFDWLVIECPLEDLLASRIKNLFRDRMSNLAGHVQFFTAASFRSLVSEHLEIVGERLYAPWTSPEVIDFIAEKDHLSPRMRMMKHLTMHAMPRYFGPIWKRLWLGHHALLCRKPTLGR